MRSYRQANAVDTIRESLCKGIELNVLVGFRLLLEIDIRKGGKELKYVPLLFEDPRNRASEVCR